MPTWPNSRSIPLTIHDHNKNWNMNNVVYIIFFFIQKQFIGFRMLSLKIFFRNSQIVIYILKMIDTKPKTITLHENHSTLHISHTFSGTQKYSVYVIWYDKEFRNSFHSLILKEEALKDIWVVNDTFQNKRLRSYKNTSVTFENYIKKLNRKLSCDIISYWPLVILSF